VALATGRDLGDRESHSPGSGPLHTLTEDERADLVEAIQDQVLAVISEFEPLGVTLDAIAYDHEIFVDGLHRDMSKPSSKGRGAEAMARLCWIADQHGLPMELSRMADETGLATYYGRFGFVDEPREGNPELMAMRRVERLT
jgi:hypothetical protein